MIFVIEGNPVLFYSVLISETFDELCHETLISSNNNL